MKTRLPTGETSFRAGRDIRGAFATGAGSSARNVKAGLYIENYVAAAAVQPQPGPIFHRVPGLPRHYRPQDADTAAVLSKLLGETGMIGITSASRAVGLHGMGGIGKTVLATALAHDARLRSAFPDGVIWLTFGRQIPILARAVELASALTGVQASFSDLAEAQAQLGFYVGQKRLLIVLDDVWEPEAVDPFIELGVGCRVLITTRDARVLERAQADRHELGLFTHEAARAFLAQVAEIDESALPPEADQIIRECGRLPLALAVVGALIRRGTDTWSGMLIALHEAALSVLEMPGGIPGREQPNVGAVLELSIRALLQPNLKEQLGNVDSHGCFLACAAFREGADIPETALLRVWSVLVPSEWHGKRVAQELVDRSLISRDAHRRYRIHDLYMDYLRRAAAPLIERHRYLLDCYRAVCPEGWVSCSNDGYIVQNLVWHLKAVGAEEQIRALLFDPIWLRRKLVAVGVNSLVEDCSYLPDSVEARRLAGALRLSAYTVTQNPDMLYAQLCGRLISDDGPCITMLLTRARLRKSPGVMLPQRDGFLDRSGGALIRTFRGQDLAVAAVAVLPDGRRVLSGAWDGTLWLWDLDTGKTLRTFGDAREPVNLLVVLPDGRRAVSGTMGGPLRLWDLDTGKALRTFGKASKEVTILSVLPDGRRALSGATEGTVRLWDLDTGKSLHTFEGYIGDHVPLLPGPLAVLPDGRRAISGFNKGELGLWNLGTGEPLGVLKGHKDWVAAVVALPDGWRALSGSMDSTLRLWDLTTCKCLRILKGSTDAVLSIAVLPEGRRAISACNDGTLRLWDLTTGKTLRTFEGHSNSVVTLAVLPDGRRALSGSSDCTLRLWALDTDESLPNLESYSGRAKALAVLPEGRRAISACNDGALRLWDLDTGHTLRIFKGHGKSVSALAVLPEGRRAISACNDGALRLWDLDTGHTLHTLEGHSDEVLSVATLTDGRRAISGSKDSALRLWDLTTGQTLRIFEGHNNSVATVAVLPDGRRAISGSWDGTLRLWDLTTGKTLRTFEGHGKQVSAVALLPRGRRAISGSWDGTLRLWDLTTGTILRIFEGHSNVVNTLAVLPDGRRALSGGRDNMLLLWDLETKDLLARHVDDHAITSIANMNRKDMFAAGNGLGRIVVFNITQSVSDLA